MALVYLCADAACTATNQVDVYLVPAAYEEYITLFLNGGFSPESFGLAFVSFLLIWVTGIGVGLILNLIKKGGRI